MWERAGGTSAAIQVDARECWRSDAGLRQSSQRWRTWRLDGIGKIDGEYRTSARDVACFNPATVTLDDIARERQPQPGAGLWPRFASCG